MKLHNSIEGDWGEFIIKMVEPSDIPAILEHLTENFHRDEPITSLCPPETPEDKFANFANSRIAKLLGKHLHLSFIAVHKSTNEIAGCQLQFKWTKEEAENGTAPHFGLHNEDIPDTRKRINKVMVHFDQPKIDIFNNFGVDALAWNFVASTTKKFRGMGLASEMYRRMVSLLQMENFKVVFSVFTSPYSRRCAEKVGFVETARVNLATILDENGQQVLPKSTKEDFASLMVLEM